MSYEPLAIGFILHMKGLNSIKASPSARKADNYAG